MTRLVAIDWGTSSLRGALLDAGGKVLEERSDARGILKVPEGGFPAVFEALFGDWMRLEGARCLISGMAGSKQGWVEAPYCACPAGRVEVGRSIIDIDVRPGSRISIVPGLNDEHDGVPDVMRGEEVQIFGAMALMDVDEGVFVLPGTHNKWATVKKGRVTGFRTFMTGEFYALLSQHSILARTLDADAPLDEAAFVQGVARADNGQGLLHNAFGARTLALFERMPTQELASYLSGLLIGEELRTQSLHAFGEVVLIGSPALTQRYTLALSATGIATRRLGAEATWAGLHALSGFLDADRNPP
ncbi:2-dehydro-3-deoxygalactonokinase [Variovorax sp. V59]|jgi:2-dehydro-3-deoxygalactonokinase|uniref:2-dehydro-3-deoxygalactonokinase n=2 Tax=Variovorax TaxID=34072 RepID=A0AAE3XYD3_VARPD|nr:MULTISPECIES: 2-dehydro-3-deoxygalactonokinase [Variovorax]MDP9963641.1 2-dehydro-3-deoxygalactonokinase [Variovorax paradoxus]MDR6426127.1 2-dehydro-3-deoxygalactonokinase [Variovorax paradoxus]MDR6451619.1 2-dehydro-3-deoxygalactonokinase [Variovorax paradoxus]TWD77581.1 2-keto-3-deoxygalactonate kinase [Variovorax beijingensis]